MAKNQQDLMHVWAHSYVKDNKTHGKDPLTHLNGVVYSYGTPIANRVDPLVALITSRNFGATATETIHLPKVKRAVRAWITVKNIEPVSQSDHMANAAEIFGRAILLFKKLQRAIAKANIYSARVLFRETKEQYQAYIRLYNLQNMPSIDFTAESIDEIMEEQYDLWRNHKRCTVLYSSNVPTLLRISKDGRKIETSKGMIYKLEEVPRIIEALDNRASLIKGYDIEYTKNGFSSGCHSISWKELDRIRQELDVVE